MRRVVVTGMGAVTPIGIGVENFWNSVKEKRTDLIRSPNLTPQGSRQAWRQRSKILIRKNLWISRQQDVWSCSVSMQWWLQRKQ